MNPAGLLFPALRFDQEHDTDALCDRGLELIEVGVGGFILFGGTAGEVGLLVARLRAASDRPLLFAADLERGCGQQFEGATRLPPAAALAHLNDLDALEFAGELTGREADALGIDWVFAPAADLDVEPRNPIVGTRAFGADPGLVAKRVSAWIRGCRRAGVLSCVKHFPGHGRTVSDSHVGLPVVDADESALQADLEPFRAGIDAGVESVMTAHVHYPALDPLPGPATRSKAIVTGLLRTRLGFDGIVVTDALIMAGAGDPADEGAAAVATVGAGVDALLYPHDPLGVAGALRSAMVEERLPAMQVHSSLDRLQSAARARERRRKPEHVVGKPEDERRVRELAERTLDWVVGTEGWAVSSVVEIVSVDDDLGGPFPAPSRDPLYLALEDSGIRVTRGSPGPDAEGPPEPRTMGGDGEPIPDLAPVLVALFSEPRGWKSRAGLSSASAEAVRITVGRAQGQGRPVAVLLFAPPGLVKEVPAGVPTLMCWGGEEIMQRAVAGFLGQSLRRAKGHVP